MKRFLVILAVFLLMPVLADGAQASGDNGSAKLDWHVSDAFIQSLGARPGPIRPHGEAERTFSEQKPSQS